MSIQHGSARVTRPKQKTPAERGEEFAAEQRRLKREAAERRSAAQAKAAAAAEAASGGTSGRSDRTG